jgi:hypothetical protein
MPGIAHAGYRLSSTAESRSTAGGTDDAQEAVAISRCRAASGLDSIGAPAVAGQSIVRLLHQSGLRFTG